MIQRDWAYYITLIPKKLIDEAKSSGKILIYELNDFFFGIPVSNPNHAFFKKILPYIIWLMQEADVITVPTDELKKSIISLFPEFKEKIKILPNYIDLEIWGERQFLSKKIS